MGKGFLLSAAAVVATFASAPTWAQDNARGARPSGRELGYFLPRTRVSAGVQQQLVRCPIGDTPPVVVTTIEIQDRVGADPEGFVRVDARSGLLSGRTTHLELRQNGTLAAFNATSQGEGGPLISAAIGAVTTLASWSVGVPAGVAQAAAPVRAPVRLTCTNEAKAAVDRLHQVRREIAGLQSQIAQGSPVQGATLALTNLGAELEELNDALTLSAGQAAVFNVSAGDFPAGTLTKSLLIPRIDYEPWFGTTAHLADEQFAGTRGFLAVLTPSHAQFAVLRQGDGSSLPEGPTPYLFYRRPVPAVVTVVPCAQPGTNNSCAPDESRPGAAASEQKAVLLPQLSGLFHIRIGNGNIFGTRRAVANFDEQGVPTMLEYGTTSGAADVAGVINSGMTGLNTYRNAETSEINRRVANLTARKALRDAQDALDEAEAE